MLEPPGVTQRAKVYDPFSTLAQDFEFFPSCSCGDIDNNVVVTVFCLAEAVYDSLIHPFLCYGIFYIVPQINIIFKFLHISPIVAQKMDRAEKNSRLVEELTDELERSA
jgi:hypothetical protein